MGTFQANFLNFLRETMKQTEFRFLVLEKNIYSVKFPVELILKKKNKKETTYCVIFHLLWDKIL